jgi:hypothetical protein
MDQQADNEVFSNIVREAAFDFEEASRRYRKQLGGGLSGKDKERWSEEACRERWFVLDAADVASDLVGAAGAAEDVDESAAPAEVKPRAIARHSRGADAPNDFNVFTHSIGADVFSGKCLLLF